MDENTLGLVNDANPYDYPSNPSPPPLATADIDITKLIVVTRSIENLSGDMGREIHRKRSAAMITTMKTSWAPKREKG